MMRGLVLFDIDGTLLRAGDREHARAFVEAMTEVFGRPIDLDGVPLAGMLDSEIARLALEREGITPVEVEAKLPLVMRRMGEHYSGRVLAGDRVTWVLAGAVESALALADAGYALGVLTGNARTVARAKLAAAGVDGLFPVGAYGDQAHTRGELVWLACAEAERHYGVRFLVHRVVLIGDTPRDIAAARAAGARVLAVATGRYSVRELEAEGADAVLPDLSDPVTTLAAVEAILSGSSAG
ncbi:HAD family hydrolase [Thermomicrobiaceae bacterium CFH 74404]|uniref:HAD family hydrolase n=2 Tax=Thermalbibacter longus TaxID=2951981 RepID=A0AA42BAL4_9BACT|nr:HAD family hydrolase [Thermalbibacter longus]